MGSTKICLTIETTGSHLGLGLTSFDEKKGHLIELGRFFRWQPGRHSDRLFPELKRLLQRKKINKRQLSLIGVDVGPGSFTGVRVGVSAARGIAQGLGLPLVGVNSLEALLPPQEDSERETNSIWATVRPALSGEVYFALYSKKVSHDNEFRYKTVREPSWTTTAQCLETFKRFSRRSKNRAGVCVVGSGIHNLAEAGSNLTKVCWSHLELHPTPESLAKIAIHRYMKTRNKKRFRFDQIIPLYLQPSWAERKH